MIHTCGRTSRTPELFHHIMTCRGAAFLLCVLFSGPIFCLPDFPVKDCLTSPIDILVLDDFSVVHDARNLNLQLKVLKNMVDMFYRFEEMKKPSSRVRLASAFYSQDKVKIRFDFRANVSLSLFPKAYLESAYSTKEEKDAPLDTSKAIKFVVDEAFSRRFGGRKEALHVVLMLAHRFPTVNLDEVRAQIARLYDTDIKLFLLQFHGYYRGEKINGTGLFPDRNVKHDGNGPSYYYYDEQVLRTLCRPCVSRNWLPYQAGEVASCYSPVTPLGMRNNVHVAEQFCREKHTSLPILETHDEMISLERNIFFLLKDRLVVANHYQRTKFSFPMGLRYDSNNSATQWTNGRYLTYRLGARLQELNSVQSCAVWLFVSILATDRDEMTYEQGYVRWKQAGGSSWIAQDCSNLGATSITCEAVQRPILKKENLPAYLPRPSKKSIKKAKGRGYFTIEVRDSKSESKKKMSQAKDAKLQSLSHVLSSLIPSRSGSDGRLRIKNGRVILEQNDAIDVWSVPRFDCEAGRYPEMVAYSWVCDGRKDCSNGRDEEVCGGAVEKPLYSAERTWCPSTTPAPCLLCLNDSGYPRYLPDENGTACASVVCPDGYLKCPRAYCVPLHFLKDGHDDCPHGEDESSYFSIKEINSNYECRTVGSEVPTILHPLKLCDDVKDCPFGDDELDCKVAACSPGLVCVAGTVTATQPQKVPIGFKASALPRDTKTLDLSGVHFDSLSLLTSNTFRNLLRLKLSRCGLKKLNAFLKGSGPGISGDFYGEKLQSKATVRYSFSDFRLVRHADFSHNELLDLGGGFSGLGPFVHLLSLNVSYNAKLTLDLDSVKVIASRIESLDLSHTAVDEENSKLLLEFTKLKKLYLRGCPISRLKASFPYTLQVLDLREIDLEDIEPDIFKDLDSLRALHVPSYKLCCPQVRGESVPAQVCLSQQDALSSCTDLMREPLLRVLLWLVGLSALLGNIVVIVYRAVWDRGFLQKGYALFVFNLSVADLLMGAYLMIVAVADVLFRGTYVWHERSWRMSDTCKVAGFLSTWSSESSAIFVFLITVDRFLVIKFPFGQVRLSPVSARVLCCFSWLIGLSIAVLPLLPPFQHWTVFSTSGMCVGLPLTTERKPGWEYSVTVFVGLNFVLFLLIAIGQILIYRTKVSSSEGMILQKVGRQAERRFKEDLAIARQLSLIVLTDFLCWFPIGIMGLLALNGHEVSKDTYAWSAVLVVPINSALNPVLYTVPVIRKKWDEIKQNYFKTGTAFSKTANASGKESSSQRTEKDTLSSDTSKEKADNMKDII